MHRTRQARCKWVTFTLATANDLISYVPNPYPNSLVPSPESLATIHQSLIQSHRRRLRRRRAGGFPPLSFGAPYPDSETTAVNFTRGIPTHFM